MFGFGQRVLVRAERKFASGHSGLVLRLLHHRHHRAIRAFTLGELVHHRAGGSAGAGDQHGAHAIGINRRGLQSCQRILIQIIGNGNSGVRGAQSIQLIAHALGHCSQVTGIDAHTAQFRAGNLDGGLHGLLDVVGIDQQRGVLAQCFNLRFKGIALGIMHQSKAVRRGANRLQSIQLSSKQVGGALESAHHSSAGGGYGSPLVGAAATHIHARTILGGRHHAGGCRSHGGIVVQNR